MIKAVIFDMYETLITHYNCPLYFGTEMATDAGIPTENFLARWRPTEYERTIGKISFEEIVTSILQENHCYNDELLHKIVKKRKATKRECFNHLHPEIIPMLQKLKDQNLRIGLISNCFSEEVDAIKESPLFLFFDAPYLSYEQGIQKPDEEIFMRCMKHLSVTADKCVYVGDGGSLELETAQRLGMKAIQAVWYFKEDTLQPVGRKKEFAQAETPLDILNYVN